MDKNMFFAKKVYKKIKNTFLNIFIVKQIKTFKK